uniref:Uncharacterized protein n=1 Tax=viral metagenome TaxID=1070528 RepID=A0A6C0IHY5_9ZZZZ
MSKRCPPGVICFENITIVIIIILLCSVLLFIHYKSNNALRRPNMPMTMPMPMPMPEDILLQDERYAPRRGLVMPINVPTQPFDPTYRQVGILTRIKGKETILPLMGRPVLSNRDKWNFYTTNDKTNTITLPITFKGRSCTSEYGCDNLYSGDVVFVEGYNDAFKVTAYDNQMMRYIPFI